MIWNRLKDYYGESNKLKSIKNENDYKRKVEMAIKICAYLIKENQRSTMD